MLRVLLFVAWIAVIVYAIADWARTSEDEMPGKLPRIVWLLIIVLTAPTFALGAVAWIIVRTIAAAESGNGLGALFSGDNPLNQHKNTPSASPVAPDDDPEFLFKLQREIQRQRSQETNTSNQKSDNPLSHQDTSQDESLNDSSTDANGTAHENEPENPQDSSK
ncbi:hypothetical protein [Schaalia sp. lx-100]|uniref:hypothetical protein n=1 Tax=Schaalia sp. lx-100 TaxID=2899081 RepID=UPI001E4F41AC|nr:hypothetical protein [Schaalia sp. lx-100]MCD4557524.1 hypothetical protein [Schaalia sp. lx-100]